MLDEIKRKRLNLTHNFQTLRPRMSSAEKRRLIEANLEKFKKDVSESRSTSPFQSANNFYRNHRTESENLYLNQSPTMKDLINPFKNTGNLEEIRKKSQQIQSPRFKQDDNVPQQEHKQQNGSFHKAAKQESEQRSPLKNQSRAQSINNNSQQLPDKIAQNIYDNSLQNSKLSSSKSPSPNELQKLPEKAQEPQQQQGQKIQRHLSFGNQSSLQYSNVGNSQQKISSSNTPKSEQQENNKLFEPSYEKKQDPNQLHFDYNQSKYGGSSDGSSAIFYTSQFREYINRDPITNNPTSLQNQHPQQAIQPITQIQPTQPKIDKTQVSGAEKEVNESFLKIGEEELSQITQSRNKKLEHIASGRSLAFSNNDESILKEGKGNQYSHYLPAVQEIVHKKLDEELVMEIEQFGRNKLKQFIEKYKQACKVKQMREITSNLKQLKKIIEMKQNYERQLKRYCFDGFLILKQYKFQEVKNDIKVDHLLTEKKQNFLKRIFDQWRNVPLIYEKQIIVRQHAREEKLKKNIFEVFRIIWYDRKIKAQADLYFLSKVFTAWRSVSAKQSKRKESIAIKQYCKTLKRTYFYKMQEGIENMRKERYNEQLAEEHYRYVMMKKCFDAWLQLCEKSPQYISLTMTSKNVFKQTLNNKWLGIKTVDFRQIKE